MSDPCCICLEDLLNGSPLVNIKCGHTFHENCCDSWAKNHTLCPVCRTRCSLRLRYRVFGLNQRPVFEHQANNIAEMEQVDEQEAPGQQVLQAQVAELQIAEPRVAEARADIAEAVGPYEMMDVAEEVEVPFEIDPDVQLEEDWQLAKDLEMAELLLFEMGGDDVKERMKPKPKRNKRCAEMFTNVDLVCVRCGKKIRHTNLPVDAAKDFICSEKCLSDE